MVLKEVSPRLRLFDQQFSTNRNSQIEINEALYKSLRLITYDKCNASFLNKSISFFQKKEPQTFELYAYSIFNRVSSLYSETLVLFFVGMAVRRCYCQRPRVQWKLWTSCCPLGQTGERKTARAITLSTWQRFTFTQTSLDNLFSGAWMGFLCGRFLSVWYCRFETCIPTFIVYRHICIII